MFHPQRKKSLERAINLTMHSNVKIDVKTFEGKKKLGLFWWSGMLHSLCFPHPGVAEAFTHPVVFHGQKGCV